MRPRDLAVLAFPRVLEALASHAVSTLGADVCRALRPKSEREAAERALDRQWEFFRLVETSGAPPLAPFPDVRASLAIAEHDGATLTGEQLVEVRLVVTQVHALRRFLRSHAHDFPALADLPAALHALPELERTLTQMLDDTGALRDDASPRLAEVRAGLRDLRHDIEQRLERLVLSSGESEGIAERYVTVRNNRFVVPVKAGAAGSVQGVVQDRSSSGETLFVEPLFAIELNNQLLLLRKEEDREQHRLLTLLTAQVGAARHELGSSLRALATIDALAAGAAFGRRLGCTRPLLGDGVVDLRTARHPELLLAEHAVTPIDVRFDEGCRALIVSGPNTGGKSVALKTLGLLTALAHAGILIPADEGSTVPAVTGIFTDLADDQSIERSLSTFSSHVVNLTEIFRTVTPPALVLLDEPGGGTDPEEGAALAVALVDRLVHAGCLVAAATHYTPVKLYALNDPHVALAAVDVDPQTFEPRYRLVYGAIGDSLGLATARRLALPDEVLAAAEAGRGEPARALAEAIARLDASRRRLDDERTAVVEERAVLAEREREQARLVADLRERKRARWESDLREARQFLRRLKSEGRALLAAQQHAPGNTAADLDAFTRNAAREIDTRAATLAEPAEHVAERTPPTVGDDVALEGSVIRGELIAIQGKTAKVQRDAVTFEVPFAKLRRQAAPAARTPLPPPTTTSDAEDSVEIRLVGLRVHEALARLERFLDDALTRGTPSVRIIHGLGTGALKRAVAEYLNESSHCGDFRDAAPEEGGPAITVADLV